VVKWRRFPRVGRDDGSAIVEFLGMSLLLLVPLLYLVVALSRIQAGAFGSEFASREASRGAVVAGVQSLERGDNLDQAVAAADRRGSAVAALAVEDFGFEVDRSTKVSFACQPEPCLSPGSDVIATVEIRVDLPGVPGFVRGWLPLGVTLKSASASAVDGFASGA
jgi:hypothetical protein